MSNPDFWRDLAERFRALKDHQLRADGHYVIGSSQPWKWSLVGSRTIIDQYEPLARRAGAALFPGAENKQNAWLEGLREQHLNFGDVIPYTEYNEEGAELRRSLGGIISDLPEASADYCCRLESEALAGCTSNVQVDPKHLPALARSALKRIKEAEKAAIERYNDDKEPYFPKHAEFSFHEQDIVNARKKVLEYLRLLAEEVLDAHLNEYLEVAPADVLSNPDLRLSIEAAIKSLTDKFWSGYTRILYSEPGSRRLRFDIAIEERTLDQNPELAPGRYPDNEQWSEWWDRMRMPNSAMNQVDDLYRSTIQKTINDRFELYMSRAASRLTPATVAGAQKSPEPQGPPVVAARKRRPGKRNAVVQRIKKKVRELKRAGHNHQQICERLGAFDRPPGAAWREFTWPVAYKRHTSAVTKWISEACSEDCS